MFNQGLSLEQAPPISIVLRFFILCAFFGLLSGLYLIFYGDQVALQMSAVTIAFVHLLLFAVVSITMIGVLFQMLPVMTSVSISNALRVAKVMHLLLALLAVALVASFTLNLAIPLAISALLILGTISVFIFKVLDRLVRLEHKDSSVVGFIVALSSFGIALVMAVVTALNYSDISIVAYDVSRFIHIRFMLSGWLFALVCAVSFRVIEMFYVSSPYPKLMQSYFLPVLFIILIIQAVTATFSLQSAHHIDMLLVAAVIIYVLSTLKLLYNRKRPRVDVTIRLWYIALISWLLSAVVYSFGAVEVGFGAFVFGLLSLIYAMSYKIVPFLVWFHLNAKGVLEAPMMADVIDKDYLKLHLYLHILLIPLLLLSLYMSDILAVVGAVFMLTNSLYAYNIYRATMLYRAYLP